MLSNHSISPHDLIGCSFEGYQIEVLVEHNDVTGIFVSKQREEYYIIKAALTQNASSLIKHEARMIQDLTHWGVVSLIDQIEIQGLPALVLHRYIRGPLTRYLGVFSTQEILTVFTGLCEICDFIHGKGICHRDVKPENIVLDQKGRPVLIDFGMSCLISEQEEHFIGTVEYAAPEVLRGGKVTYESELYCVASVIYTLIHGVAPSTEASLRTEHGLGMAEDSKLNLMLHPEPSSRSVKTEQVNPKPIPKVNLNETKKKSSSYFLFTAAIVGIFCLCFALYFSI